VATPPKFEKRWLVLAVMCLVLFIISIDNTVLNLALPSIANSFEASAGELQWIVDAYTLVFASLLITTGAVGDRYGRKRLLMAGLALFGIGSLGAALAVSTQMLIGFRAELGLAGAMIMPSTLSILTDVFRDPKERAKAIAIWSSIFSIGAGIGPIIGGLLINHFHWSSVFYLNLPIVAICITAGLLVVPESNAESAPRPDIPGVLLSIVGLVALVFGMIHAGETSWSDATTLLSFLVAAVFLGAFIWWENRAKEPMLPLEFFKNRSFSGANSSLTLSAFAMMGGMYFFSQFFQTVRGYTPLVAALAMFPMTPAVFTATMFSLRVDRKIGTNRTMALGLLLSGAGLFFFSWAAAIDTPYFYVLLMQVLLGIGIGFTMSPATNAIMSSLPRHRAGIGSAMNDTTRQLGGALGIAVLGALMNGVYRVEVNQLSGMNGVSETLLAMVRGSVQNAHLAAQQLNGELGAVVVRISSQAFVDGMREAMLIASGIMALSAVTAYLLVPPRVTRSEEIPLAEKSSAGD
jgi:EmrB/QacA subfamily drug resistance transporter